MLASVEISSSLLYASSQIYRKSSMQGGLRSCGTDRDRLVAATQPVGASNGRC